MRMSFIAAVEMIADPACVDVESKLIREFTVHQRNQD